MRFIIIDGKPYYFTNDKAYECEIAGENVTIGAEKKLDDSPIAVYTLHEIKCRLTVLSSMKKRQKKDRGIGERDNDNL